MYTGRYITQQGKLGHEIINLFKADDGKFYIWLNSMGICTRKDVEESNILMVRSVNSHLYKVLAKAEKCHLCGGANIPRDKKNKDKNKLKNRYDQQKALGVTYDGKCPMDDIFHEQDMFATFYTANVYEPVKDIYITNDKDLENVKKGIYYAEFKISEAMRAYISKTANAYAPLEKLLKDATILNKQSSIAVKNQTATATQVTSFNFFKLIRKDKDELSFSNALAYFIERVGINNFLQTCLNVNASFLNDAYTLLREKNNIDISFFGDKHVVIIENKIDSNITVDKRKTLISQIKDAVELYFIDDKGRDKETIETQIMGLINSKFKARGQQASQLSKYYLYAVAYLLSKGVAEDEVDKHIQCFLLIPEYAKNRFGNLSEFLLYDKYKIITYIEIYKFFDNNKKKNIKYLDDFISALVPLKNQFDNEIEEECKYRFLKLLGKFKGEQ